MSKEIERKEKEIRQLTKEKEELQRANDLLKIANEKLSAELSAFRGCNKAQQKEEDKNDKGNLDLFILASTISFPSLR